MSDSTKEFRCQPDQLAKTGEDTLKQAAEHGNYMHCTVCGQHLGAHKHDEEETGGSLQKGYAHGACFWKRVAGIRLDREEQLRTELADAKDRIEELEELLRERSKPWWKRKLDAALARRFPT